MKFVMSYSCGKDSTLALHDMMAQGHEPVALITMFNEEAGRSFFHGADLRMLQAYSDALKIPFLITPTTGEAYHLEMEKSLRKAAAMARKLPALAISISKITAHGAKNDAGTPV